MIDDVWNCWRYGSGGPHGITMVSDNEMVFSQRNAGLWELNYDTREQTHKAGPEVMSDLITGKGWNDGASHVHLMRRCVAILLCSRLAFGLCDVHFPLVFRRGVSGGKGGRRRKGCADVGTRRTCRDSRRTDRLLC